jgi:hypothetical protein
MALLAALTHPAGSTQLRRDRARYDTQVDRRHKIDPKPMPRNRKVDHVL